MEQSLSFKEEGNIIPEDVEIWTEELSNVLDTSQAQHKFRIYLQLKQIKSKQALLEFWEKCNTFLLETLESNRHTHKDGAKDTWC
jgi:hypothetical protein